MPTVTFRIVNNRLPEIARRLPQAAHALVAEALFEIEADIKLDMAQAKSGAMYGSHQASAPGESPAIDTGNLVNSIQVTDVVNGEGAVYTNAEYAEILEFGGVNLAARPFMTPAGDRARPRFLRRAGDLESQL